MRKTNVQDSYMANRFWLESTEIEVLLQDKNYKTREYKEKKKYLQNLFNGKVLRSISEL